MNKLRGLDTLRDSLPPAKPVLRAEEFPSTPPPNGPAEARVRLDDGAKDGAETVIESLGLTSDADWEAWRTALQRGLAAVVERRGDSLVAKGDHRFTLPDLLLRRGVQRVRSG